MAKVPRNQQEIPQCNHDALRASIPNMPNAQLAVLLGQLEREIEALRTTRQVAVEELHRESPIHVQLERTLPGF